jgi:uncharacterized protein HemY
MNDVTSISKLIKRNRTEEARKAIAKYYRNDLKMYFYYLGISFLPEKDYNKVILFLNTSRLNGFRNYLLHYNLGIAYLGKEDYKSAEENFIESINLKRNNSKKAYRVIKTALTLSDDSRLIAIEKKLLRDLSSNT